MAWPITPLTTYVASSTPVIKASDLNDIQTAINRAFLGTYSFRWIKVDGVGGVSSTVTSGSVNAVTVETSAGIGAGGNIVAQGYIQAAGNYLQAGLSISSATAPTAAVERGATYYDTAPLAWAKVTNNGSTATLVRGVNIASASFSSTGNVLVTLTTGATNTLCPVATIQDPNGTAHGDITLVSSSTTTIRVLTWASGSVATDYDFFLVVFGD